MTRLLAIDTTGDYCSLALKDGDRVLQCHQSLPRQHARQILPLLDQLVAESGWARTSLDAVVYGRGPGSFTGIRIAAGIAQGIALGADCGVIPVSTLQTLAMEAGHANPDARQVWVALDARMRELYVARFQIDQGFPVFQGDESLLTPNQLPVPPTSDASVGAYFAGSGWQTDYGFSDAWTAALALQPPKLTLPKAIWGAELALALLHRDASVKVAPEQALPVYLRDKVTWDNKPKVGG
ncbi:tRNA (adenosine(37)-N6)-threonylcarbamoyltransferase complex dimerization subunit type 1 TsaB [Saccharospirillum impatiens]|uniref:tRNA (adenosine(37)-N6)-threonylcarbamoyltransferase complex dimerization subunit type 1 TsaB n=1 Tax=Saccharospirillum impatiens TaxID=169438 RepID=UPI000424A004|nr:tRNA (adenosine(37)-N6)-threonylcarbamoyltransferase complex dimerization subunit type 1 TsaB [Saccharospirillum impatiens]